ncbi:hypothetical protein GOB94_04390 [Granulicella sp. 5B5]|uniref:glycosyl hydrolase n=1 Tax=Granulicella sp. 5B5 TaxID=1617967 RepID=UPI0015F4A1D0|nr:glycosyl hydrolase [Granulicella sp. 5B5]QMV18011.1 hypothetical protein GOB94_04390 [Granulicella sp. 5B5]
MITAFRTSLLLATLAVAPLVAQSPNPAPLSPSLPQLEQGFLNPPNSAKPMVRWWWFGPAVVKPEILHELEQMKADGIGGAELAFVYPEVLDDPAKGLKNLPFLSPAMLDAVRYAQEQGRRLGLRIDITLCSGWPYGGPSTPLAQAAGRLRTIEIAVPANATSVSVPTLGQGESFLSASIAKGHLSPTGGPQGHLLPGRPVGWDAKSAQPLTLASGTIAIGASSSPRVALFFVAGHTKQEVKRAAVDADGYVLDPFSHQAVATHLEKVGGPLLSAFGSTPPYAIFSDSLEAYGADWTPDLPAQFLRRRGYDLIPHLPELVAGGSSEADKVRHDWGVTLTELVNENYLTQINNWASEHHTKFRSQTYGEPAVDFSSQNLVALAEGEGPQWRAFSTLRWATSANHVFGHDVTSGETFTWLHSPVFRATPLDMKAEADIDFIMGENQLIFHGWPYSPPDHEVPEPGWSLYAAASFNNHNPWHPVMPAVTSYIARLSWLLRQGQPANQVAILLPTDDAWASFTPSHVSVTAAMQKLVTPALMSAILSAGYNADFIDAAAIDKIGFGTHQVLLLPPTDRIPLETLKKIHEYAAKGGKVIAVQHVPTMDAEGNASSELTQLTEAIAVVPDYASLPQALHNAAAPDLRLTNADDAAKNAIGFIRRKLTQADVYYVVNTSNEPVNADAAFATYFSHGAQWSPETGRAIAAVSAENEKINLAPYGSALYVFSDAASPHTASAEADKQLVDITENWKVDFTSLSKSSEEHTLTDWTTDPATVHYSGEVDYTRDVTLTKLPHAPVYLAVDGGTALPGAPNSPPEHPVLGSNGLPNPLITPPGPGMHAYFEPPIREAALVVINGQPAGALWHPPYRLDVSKLLKPGVNHIEIRVFNTALNAWSALPPHDYKPLIAKYGDRFQMQDLDKVKSISSGILGTIHLVTESAQ